MKVCTAVSLCNGLLKCREALCCLGVCVCVCVFGGDMHSAAQWGGFNLPPHLSQVGTGGGASQLTLTPHTLTHTHHNTTHTPAHTPTHTHTRMHTHIRSPTHIHTNTRTHAQTHARTHSLSHSHKDTDTHT